MKNKWIFFALAPLFSFAAPQEEWLSETSFPEELQENPLKNKEISAADKPSSKAKQRREQRASELGRREKLSLRAQKQSLKSELKEPVQEQPKTSQWSAFLERLTLKKAPKKDGLNIVTNRKSRTDSLSQERIEEENLAEEEQASIPAKERPSKERDALQYHYRAREKISAESDKRTEEMVLKRKSELLKKNNRRIQKEND